MTDTIIKLKPCPFCGSKGKSEIEVGHITNYNTVLKVGCSNSFCFCRHEKNLGCAPSKEFINYELSDMIDEWNNRT